MGYRDEGEAARAQANALEAEVKSLREENAALKSGRKANAPKPPPPEAKAPPAPPPREASDGQVALFLASIFGGLALIAIPAGIAISLRRWEPTPVGMLSVAALALGGPALATAGLRLFFPSVPIYETLEGGEQARVHRSARARRVHFAIALALYVPGAVATFFAR